MKLYYFFHTNVIITSQSRLKAQRWSGSLTEEFKEKTLIKPWMELIKELLLLKQSSSHVRITGDTACCLLSMIWLSLWLYIPPKPPWWRRISAAWRPCVRSHSGRAGGGGGGAKGSPGITIEIQDKKGHCGTVWPIQEHITSCPSSSRILRTWTAHFPELKVPFLSSAVNRFQQQQQRSGLTICRHSNHICWQIYLTNKGWDHDGIFPFCWSFCVGSKLSCCSFVVCRTMY